MLPSTSSSSFECHSSAVYPRCDVGRFEWFIVSKEPAFWVLIRVDPDIIFRIVDEYVGGRSKMFL